MVDRPRQLLTKTTRSKAAGKVWNWTIPALAVTLSDGSKLVTCPQAGACAQFCYARAGAYRWDNVKAAHLQRLEWALDDLSFFRDGMVAELQKKKYAGCAIRIHDSGDFFSDDYFTAWAVIATMSPHLTFYAYTKEVSRSRRLEWLIPPNMVLIYSLGGKEDHLIDLARERHNDVFPSIEALEAAGYTCASEDDNVAWRSENHRIGVLSNNIPQYTKKMGGRRFSEIESGRRGA